MRTDTLPRLDERRSRPQTALVLSLCLLAAALRAGDAAAQVACGGEVRSGEEAVLGGDLVCDGGDAIVVTGPAVLDLNGFTIRCEDRDGDGRIPRAGIIVQGSRAVVRNGRVTGCEDGVFVFDGGRHRISELVLVSNANSGIRVQSDANDIVDVSTFFNGNAGFDVTGKRNLVFRSTATGNENIGFRSVGANTFRRSIASGNGGEGFLVLGERALVTECRAIGNREGFRAVGSRHRFIENEAENNQNGLVVTGGASRCRLVENFASENDFNGILIVGDANKLVENRAEQNGQVGILLFETERNLVTRSEARGNGVVDLSDRAPDCRANRWRRNGFGSANLSCIR